MDDEIKKPFNCEVFERVDGRWRLRRKQNPSPHTCAVAFCQRDPMSNRKLCCKCHSREWRANNPLKYAWWNLKNRAKQRGHVFTITFEDFKTAVEGTGYSTAHGRFAHNLSIDRKDHTKGYEPGNLDVKTVGENARKRWVEYPA